MAEIPQAKNDISALIDEHHERQRQGKRYHLGVSGIGEPCDRRMWLQFRWAVAEKFPGRVLRLFRRGHHEETWIVQDLRAIGVDIRDTEGSQARVDFGAHVSGSMDGIIYGGVPQAPKAKHVAEFKTHSKKSFDDLVKKGVKDSKPMHWAQMQAYMLGAEIDRALYVAVCKDDDRMYSERVKLDKERAQWLVERAQRIALSDETPPPISTDPSWYQCRFCPAHGLCHGQEYTRNTSCRTCAHATPRKDSTWYCERWEADIPYSAQPDGCPAHVLHPDMVPWKMGDAVDDWTANYIIDGQAVANGESGFSSSEIIANPTACASGDKTIEKLRSELGAKVVG